jgi:hypothetical protein
MSHYQKDANTEKGYVFCYLIYVHYLVSQTPGIRLLMGLPRLLYKLMELRLISQETSLLLSDSVTTK